MSSSPASPAPSDAQGGSLAGEAFLVTGAASGIGRATVRRLLVEGAKVLASDRNLAALNDAVKGMEATEGQLVTVGLDVTREEDWKAALDRGTAAFGSLEGIVNSAGVCSPKPLPQEDLAHWKWQLDTNLTGSFLAVREGSRVLGESGDGGSIVLLGSASGRRPPAGAVGYAVSKAAVATLAQAAALELASAKIRVNAVVPGGVATPMWTSQPMWPSLVQSTGGEDEAFQALASEVPMGRFAEAGEVAELIVWLLSARSGFATGAEYVLDGGYSV